MDDRRYRVLLVSSSGGVLLDLLALRPWWSRHAVSWIAVQAPDTAALLKNERVHWEREQSDRHLLPLFAAIVRALKMVRADRPDLIISAGQVSQSGSSSPPGCCASRLSGWKPLTSSQRRGSRAGSAGSSRRLSWSSGLAWFNPGRGPFSSANCTDGAHPRHRGDGTVAL
jgi:hypothetical protein